VTEMRVQFWSKHRQASDWSGCSGYVGRYRRYVVSEWVLVSRHWDRCVNHSVCAPVKWEHRISAVSFRKVQVGLQIPSMCIYSACGLLW
jgi:hypothetical protein